MSTCALLACEFCLSQDNVDCRFSLAIRNDQVDPQTGLPRILGGWFVLIKSAEILKTANLCHGKSSVNSCLRQVELDRVQDCWVNNSFDFFHSEITRKPVYCRYRSCKLFYGALERVRNSFHRAIVSR